MEFSVKADVAQVLKSLDDIQRNGVQSAAARSLNKTLTTVAAEAARQIKADIGPSSGGIKIGDIKAQLQKLLAKPRALTATLRAQGKRIPIIKIDPNAVQTATGVVYRSGSTNHEIPHAFLTMVKNGHRGVFARRGQSRLPISEKYGPSIPKVFLNNVVLAAMQKTAETRWEKVFQQELNYELQKWK